MALISLKNICRVCLSSKEVTLPLSTIVKGSNLTEMINAICSSVKMKIGDKYPQNICIACFENLKNAWEFKTLCENTQDSLLKFYDECYSYNPNDKDNDSIPFTSENVTVKTETNDAGVKKEILDTKTMKNPKDFMSSSSNFGEVLDDKLNDSSATIARLFENRQILVKNMNRSNLMKSKYEYKPNILTKHKQQFLIEELPISYDKCITKTESWFLTQELPITYEKCVAKSESSNNDGESCPINRNDSGVDDTSGCDPVSLDNTKVNININHSLGKKRERVKQTGKQENSLSVSEKQNQGEEMIRNIDSTDLKWNTVSKKKAPKVGPCQKEPKDRKSKQKSKDSNESNICPVCGKLLRSNVTRHIRTYHKGVRSFTCKICQKSFKDKAYLKDHENQHTGNKKYLCALCGLAFVQHSGYRQHLRTHPEISRNKCQICNKGFTNPSILQDHINSHNNERKYSCNICHKRFFAQKTLKKHSVTHQERKHKCEVCNKVFHESHGLKRHILVHTGVKPFQCDVCKAKFTQKSDMRNHIMRHFKSADGMIPRSNKKTALSTYRMQDADLSYPWACE